MTLLVLYFPGVSRLIFEVTFAFEHHSQRLQDLDFPVFTEQNCENDWDFATTRWWP